MKRCILRIAGVSRAFVKRETFDGDQYTNAREMSSSDVALLVKELAQRQASLRVNRGFRDRERMRGNRADDGGYVALGLHHLRMDI